MPSGLNAALVTGPSFLRIPRRHLGAAPGLASRNGQVGRATAGSCQNTRSVRAEQLHEDREFRALEDRRVLSRSGHPNNRAVPSAEPRQNACVVRAEHRAPDSRRRDQTCISVPFRPSHNRAVWSELVSALSGLNTAVVIKSLVVHEDCSLGRALQIPEPHGPAGAGQDTLAVRTEHRALDAALVPQETPISPLPASQSRAVRSLDPTLPAPGEDPGAVWIE